MDEGRGPERAQVRRALRAALEACGYHVASDSHGLRRELYIIGENDLARALFEFMPSAREAFDSMYQGSWGAGLPPRFVVLPSEEAGAPALEMLEQIRVAPVFFDTTVEGIEFPGLEALLAAYVR